MKYPDIFLTNTRSLFNKFEEFYITVNALQPDIVNICETWLHDDATINDLDLFSIPYYTSIFNNRCKKHGGGIAIWIKNVWTYFRIQNEAMDINSLSYQFEYLSIGLYDAKMVFLLLYIPPASVSMYKKLIIKQILSFCEFLISKLLNYNLCLLGDLNNLCFDEIAQCFNLCKLVNIPTRSNRILDQVYLHKSIVPKYFPAKVNAPITNSDHCIVWIKACHLFNHNGIKAKKTTKLIYNFRDSNIATFHDAISKVDFSFPDNCDIDNMVSHFYNLF